MRPGHRFIDGFRFAWDGLARGAVRDRNLRVHLGLGVLAGAFAAHAPVTPGERAVLVLCIAAVIAAEALNSAIEAAVDLASPEWDERARTAKDAAAGAVLASAAGSVLALVAIAGPAAGALAARARTLPIPAAGALAAAIAAGLLPRPSPRSLGGDVALGALAFVGLVGIALGAEGQAGTVAAALCVAIGVGGAARRRE
jgi:diacylglycerol kinase (ATP)